MKYTESKFENGIITVFLIGHIDSANAAAAENEVHAFEETCADVKGMVLNASKLEYISSAGLRIILRLRKKYPDLKITDVSSEIYEILDMTGFTEMMKVEKAYRCISVEGCEVIGQGANGKVYRIDADTIVKVYHDQDSLPAIQHERELARKALILGVPTAIPYDVVKVGDSYGSVYELLNAKSFASLLIEDSSKLDEIVKMSTDLLKKIHATEVEPGLMPEMKKVALDWAEFLVDYIPRDQYEKLHAMVEEIPEDLHMLHGDYHLKNVMLQGDEALLIDMDTLCTGHPVFEFASIYNAYIGYGETDHNNILEFLGIPIEETRMIWDKLLHGYFDDRDEATIRDIEKKARILGYTRIIRRAIRRKGLETEKGRAYIEYYMQEMAKLLSEVDSLLF